MSHYKIQNFIWVFIPSPAPGLNTMIVIVQNPLYCLNITCSLISQKVTENRKEYFHFNIISWRQATVFKTYLLISHSASHVLFNQWISQKLQSEKTLKYYCKKFYHTRLKICLIVFLNQLFDYLNLLCTLTVNVLYLWYQVWRFNEAF